VTINGNFARVYPNGAFIAFLPNPPLSAPRYDLLAVVGHDTARASLPVRIQEPRTPLPTSGSLTVDTASIAPRASMLLRPDERVRLSVRAPANATAWVTWPGGIQLLSTSGAANDSIGQTLGADLAARYLREGGTLFVARSPDTLSFSLARMETIDSLAPRWVRAGGSLTLPDTDRLLNARPLPGGTYKWFPLSGTLLELTGRVGGFSRLRLDSQLEVWAADGDLVPSAYGASTPRRVTLNARVRNAPGYVDLVIPMSGGERPAYFVEEEARALRLTLYATRANTDIINYAEDDTLVRSVEWKQVTDDRAEFSVYLRQPVYGYLVLWEGNSLVLRVRRAPVVDPRRPLRGLTIVVDPGHPPIGSTGPTGLYEAQAVLTVGEKLKQLLEARGATVVMTRTTMDPVDLGLRPVIARRADANAFVSIHLNAYPDGVNPFVARNGSGTYFFRMLSEPLARPVQRGLVRHMGLPNLGIYYDNLAVVRQTWMPSVLTEGAFVIIPEQEAALRTPEFQERYALGIADGLEDYFRWLSKQ
jgi:N-acetylmuramoyl-L-alanine amidase